MIIVVIVVMIIIVLVVMIIVVTQLIFLVFILVLINGHDVRLRFLCLRCQRSCRNQGTRHKSRK